MHDNPYSDGLCQCEVCKNSRAAGALDVIALNPKPPFMMVPKEFDEITLIETKLALNNSIIEVNGDARQIIVSREQAEDLGADWFELNAVSCSHWGLHA